MQPAVRYISAAAILVGVLAWLGQVAPGPVALADVIRATERHALVRYRLKQFTIDRNFPDVKPDESDDSRWLKSTVYVDLATPRLRLEYPTKKSFNDMVDFTCVMTQDNRKDRFLRVITEAMLVKDDQLKDDFQRSIFKMAKEAGLPRKQATLSRVGRDDVKPFSDLDGNGSLLESLREFQARQGTTSSKVDLDGRPVLRYHLEGKDETSTLWVDPATKLPLRIDRAYRDPTPRIAKNRWIYSDFEWDPKVADPEALFSVEPPPGYKVEDFTDKP